MQCHVLAQELLVAPATLTLACSLPPCISNGAFGEPVPLVEPPGGRPAARGAQEAASRPSEGRESQQPCGVSCGAGRGAEGPPGKVGCLPVGARYVGSALRATCNCWQVYGVRPLCAAAIGGLRARDCLPPPWPCPQPPPCRASHVLDAEVGIPPSVRFTRGVAVPAAASGGSTVAGRPLPAAAHLAPMPAARLQSLSRVACGRTRRMRFSRRR